MRTKNLNLKKKIAFIASVAMIASTAAYLPAEVITNLEASASVIGFDGDKELYDADNKPEYKADAAKKLDTVYAYIKINGKYLCANKENNTEYKLTTTADTSLNATWIPVIANEQLEAILTNQVPDGNGGKKLVTAKFGSVVVSNNNDTMVIDTEKPAIEIPYVADAKDVSLEFVAKKGAVLSDRSISEVTMSLNEYGIGKLNKQHEYVVGISKDSSYEEETDNYKKDDNGDRTPIGSYEVIDLSNLTVVMGNKNLRDDTQEIKSFDAAASASIKEFAGLPAGANENNYKTDDNKFAFVEEDYGTKTPDELILDEEDIYADTYEVKKIGNVYAKVLTYTLKKAITPDTVIKVDTGVYSTWTASGSGVSKGIVTISADKTGYAKSGLVTMTQGTNKEYYVYVVKNPKNALEAEKTDANDHTDAPFAGKLSFDKFRTGDTAGENGVVDVNDVEFDGDYKIERKIVTEKIKGVKTYVTKYIVYNNQKSDDYDADGANKVVTFKLANTDDDNVISWADNTAAQNLGTADVTYGAGTINGNTTIYTNPKNGAQVIQLELNSAGTGESAPLVWTYHKDAVAADPLADPAVVAVGDVDVEETFIVEFTNQYEIKYDNQWEDNKEDATKKYDGEVSVTGKSVTNPGDIDRPGFEFRGWLITNDGVVSENYVYNADNGSDQLDETNINPNISLTADYKGLFYNVELNSNGGYFKKNIGKGSLTSYQSYPGVGEKMATKCTFTNQVRALDNSDITYWKLDGNAVDNNTVQFLGWSTDPNAKTAMNVRELEAAFPGENKTLKLYAVWSNEETSVDFYTIGYDQNGSTLETDGKIGKLDIQNAWKTAEKAEFERAADGYITVTPGEKFGTLPTPYQKGYIFDGWYAAVFNDSKTEVTAERVTEDTIVEAKYFVDYAAMDGRLGTTVNLYAKFIQKKNTITFDIGDGLWANNEIDDEDGSLPATVMYNAHGEGSLTYRRPNGTIIDDNEWAAVDNPQVGSNYFTKFRNWSITGTKTTYTTLAAVRDALKKMDTLDDVVIKANYENTNQSTSGIFLNANEGAFYKYKAAENDPTTKKPTYFYQIANNTRILTNDAPANQNDWVYSTTNLAAVQKSGLAFDRKSAGTKTDTVYKIDGVYAENVNADGYSYQVARPGYTFTGWYLDKECTQKYTFDVYPSKGTETILYAGWQPSTSVRYWVEYDIFNGDNSEATDLNADGGTLLKYRKTFMGEIGSTVNAKDITINVKDGAGTLTTYTKYVYDPVLSKNLDDQNKELKAKFDVKAIGSGRFEQAEPYTTIYGRYREEGFQSEAELTAPTGVNVNGKKVTWTAADGAVKYQIVKVVGDKSYDGATSTTTSAELKSIPDQTFKVQVKAFDKNGNVKISDPVTVQVSALDPATNVAISDDGKVTWTASKKAVKYQILQQFSETDKDYSAYVTDTEYQLDPTDKAFDLYVIAKDANGKSIRSTVVKGQPFGTVTELGKPVNVKYDAATNTVTWDEASNAVKYNVCKIVNGKKYYKAPKAGEKSVTFSSKTAAFGYYVIAYDEAGKTATSAVQYAPGRPTNIKIASDKQTVSFTGVTGAKFYKLKKVSGGKAYYKKVTTTSGKFDTALKAGDKVYVVAFMDEKGTNYVSSAAVTVK